MNLIKFVEYHPYFSLLGAIGTGTIITLFKDNIREIILSILGIFIVKKYVIDSYTNGVVYDYLNSKYKGFGVSDETYEAKWEFIRPLDDEYNVWYKSKSYSTRLWFYKKLPLFLLPSFKQKGEALSIGSGGSQAYLYFRWTVNWNKLLEEAGAFRDQKLHVASLNKDKKKFAIIKHTGAGSYTQKASNDPDGPESENKGYSFHSDSELMHWKEGDIGNPIADDPVGFLSVNKPTQIVLDTVSAWHKDKDWYKERGLQWKLGVLLYGKPGAGKTTIIRTIAEAYDMPLHVFDLATLDNFEFVNSWNSSQSDKPRIVVFEDWDTIFHGRKNQILKSDLDLGVILNAIDGVEVQNGLLLFITTNRVEHVDEAVGKPIKDQPFKSTRPGRIDLCVEMKPLDKAGRIKMANRILKDNPEIAKQIVDEHIHIGAVQFQDICVVKAKELRYGKVHVTGTDN